MLHVNDLTHRIEGRVLFDQATLYLPAKAKYGLVGRNGTGKSTLFRLIRGEASPDDGEVFVQPGARLGSVAQEAPGGPVTVMDYVLAADTERTALLEEAETATDPNRIAEIQTRLADIDAHSAEARAGAILHGLGFSAAAQQRRCAEFSGGWRMRVALAATLFAEPDLLLLDEPTNYLDLEGAIWLETHLRKYPGAVLIISHDRDLLNASVDAIVHLKDGKLTIWEGGYDQFERQLAERQTLQMKLKERQEEKRRHLQSFVDRFRAKASKAKQAQSRVKMLEKMTPIATSIESPVAPFEFPVATRRMGNPLIRIEDGATGYTQDAPVLTGMDLRIDIDDRIGLLGRNGSGKSTFAKLLTGQLPLTGGTLRMHKKAQIAHFHQHQIDALNPRHSAYDHILSLMEDATEAQRRARLARFGLPGDRQETPAGSLSGGEKARLLMNLISFHGAHLMILDEPTNHLDMDSRQALIEAINAYEGAVIVISHDRHLIEACVDRLWLCADGTIAPYDGDLADYRRLVLKGEEEAKPRGASKPAGGQKTERRRDAAEAREKLKPLKAEAAKWEKEAERLRGVLEKIDAGLATPGLWEKDPNLAAELNKKRARAEELIEAAETKWLEAEEKLEAARAEAGV
ncbi:ATP-binding cassette domain-containing protein [Marinicauda algicola]|uniref:ATP-binding cassette domain-containing protein n=1 Tax=Marinicauda algicola TaxID=2029849 RepID=A0A4S2H3M2_9PROT|nr:ABC-F family ATP-binding cassette domain-containing protein [Marinicauda algicola]TGY89862.1 ATP-binding cassette domain-containing protein [Marinicauda algicola]